MNERTNTASPRPQPWRRWVRLALGSAVALFLCAAGNRAAWAGPPYVTDDPEPVELHHWEVYLSSIYLNGPAGPNGTLPHVEINYGAAPNLQLHLIVPNAFAQPPGEPLRLGYGDTELGAKYRFIEETKRRPMVGIFPLLEVPTGGSESRGLTSGHLDAFLPIWLQKSWGPWTTYGGGGYWSVPGPGNQNYWFTGWLLQRELCKHLTLGGEIYRTSGPVLGQGGSGPQVNFNLGGQYNFDEGHHLLFSAGRSLSGDTTFSSYIGFQWTFGPKGEEKGGEKEGGAAHEKSSRAPLQLVPATSLTSSAR